MSEFQSNKYNGTTWKSAMELPQEPLDDDVKEKIIAVVSYVRDIDKDKLEARLVKEDKVYDPYKIFGCKKKDPPVEEKKENNFYYNQQGQCVEPYRPPPVYCYEFPMEEQSGPTPEAAIKKFFTEAVKALARKKKTEEKKFAKLEKDIASMDYLVTQIEKYAEENAKLVEDKLETKEDNSKKDTVPVPPTTEAICRAPVIPALPAPNVAAIVKANEHYRVAEFPTRHPVEGSYLQTLYKDETKRAELPALNGETWKKIVAL